MFTTCHCLASVFTRSRPKRVLVVKTGQRSAGFRTYARTARTIMATSNSETLLRRGLGVVELRGFEFRRPPPPECTW